MSRTSQGHGVLHKSQQNKGFEKLQRHVKDMLKTEMVKTVSQGQSYASLRTHDMSLTDDPTFYVSDYAELNLKDFSDMLEEINDLSELAGIANRRKVLNAPELKRYSDEQRKLILSRKYELQRKIKK